MSAPLLVGVPTEIKADEGRVALTPDGVRELLHAGAAVLVQSGAGADSSIPDDDYRRAGATIVTDAAEVWERADLVCKVKEPLESEFVHFRPGLVLFTYLHLAAYPQVADALLSSGGRALGETAPVGLKSLGHSVNLLVDLVLRATRPSGDVSADAQVRLAVRYMKNSRRASGW